eukprot:TRINITY_DN1253_c0_g1_i2.p1 TRINITY_DN1253_c0_g1~~TRINITY_DN1253_c0_g1_i2.p1  ORF type:complete len:525 (+),score=202.12 TRINITY_DN1253_c0_g1_i2:725-2299(+)
MSDGVAGATNSDNVKDRNHRLAAHKTVSYWYVEAVRDVQDREDVESATTLVSFRTVHAYTNAYLGLDGNNKDLRMRDLDNLNRRTHFTVTLVKGNTFKNVCPKDANGRTCGGHGSCQNSQCNCNAAYTGNSCDKKRERANCHAVGDPHWASFDRAYYNFYETGEYLLYGEPDDPQGEAVAEFMRPWGRVVSIMDTVTVRRANEYVSVDISRRVRHNCKDVTGWVNGAGGAGRRLKSGLHVMREGSGYHRISSPSGLIVRISWPNVYVSVYQPRLGTARGLCGNNDRNPGNDGSPYWRYREPNKGYTRSLRIADGKVYHYGGNRWGVKNNEKDVSFKNCKANNVFFNFLALDGVKITPKELKEEKKAAEDQGLELAESEVMVYGTATDDDTVEGSMKQGVCSVTKNGDKGRKAQAAAFTCCAKVLQSARAIKNKGDAPKGQSALTALVTKELLAKAWAGDTPPDADVVRSDYTDCLEDYCFTENCKFADELAEGVKEQQQDNKEDQADQKKKEDEDKAQRDAEHA